MPNPILVSGLMRSGTTWTSRMIALSPKMFYVPEPFNILREPIHLLNAGTNYPYFPEINIELYHKIRSGVGLSFTKKEFGIFMRQSPSPKYHLYHLVRYGTLNLRLKKGMKPVIQDPLAIFMAPWLNKELHILPLFLFRHPAAYINSMKRMKWGFNFDWLACQKKLMDDILHDFADDIYKLAPEKFIPFSVETQALVWNIFTTVMLSYKNKYPDWLFYRHEDLSREPVDAFKNIYKEVGLEISAPIIKKIEDFTGTGNTTEAKAGKMHTLKRNSRENIKLWQKQLNADDIKKIHSLTAPVAGHLYTEDDWR